MAQRISRAKQTIKASGVPFQMPTEQERAERLRAVLHVLYLIFNEGYTTSDGPQLHRPDLSLEAIRLTRSMRHLLPGDAEVEGLLALMLLTDARRARTYRTGRRADPAHQAGPGTMESRGDHRRDCAAYRRALKGLRRPYQLQAAIAAVHDEAARAEDTDWPQILALYELLKRMSGNPMVMLNHAIAAAMVHGPRTGLGLLDALDADGRLAGHHRLDAVRAHLLELAGELRGRHRPLPAWRPGRTTNLPERNYLITQAARLSEAGT